MSEKNISYNSYDLQTEHFITKNIIYRNAPEKEINLQQISRNDGFVLQNTRFTQKQITVEGFLSEDSEASLKSTLDAMKAALSQNEKNLDIDDGGTTMRFVCSVESINIPEDFYHISDVPYSIKFKCQPFATSTNSVTSTNTITQSSSSPFTDSIVTVGSYGPKPKIKILCADTPATDITQIVFNNTTTNESITVLNLVLDNTGDYLEIDCDEMTVKSSYDGGTATQIDFTGVFPSFIAGTNTYSITITGGTTFSLTESIVYYPNYI